MAPPVVEGQSPQVDEPQPIAHRRTEPSGRESISPLALYLWPGGEWPDPEAHRVVGLSLGLVGSQRDVTGLDLGLLSATSTQTGAQLGVLLSTAGQEGRGLQLAGLVNTAGQIIPGNRDFLSYEGVQVAGLFNGVGGDLHGAQLGGFNAAAKLSGAQLGFIGNSVHAAGGKMLDARSLPKSTGAQVGLLTNQCSGRLSGCQISVLYNHVEEAGVTVQGRQIAFGGEMRGVQMGLINSAESLKGVQFGLLNIDHSSWLPYLPLIRISW